MGCPLGGRTLQGARHSTPQLTRAPGVGHKGAVVPTSGPGAFEDRASLPQRDRLDRGRLWLDVLGEDRGADPPGEAGGAGQAEGPGLQAADGRPLRRGGGGQPLPAAAGLHAHRPRGRDPGAPRCWRAGGGDRRGPVLRPRGRAGVRDARGPGHPGDLRGPGSGLPGTPLRPHAPAVGGGRVRHQGPRHLRGLRQSREPQPAAGGGQRAGDGRGRRRLRGALPPLSRARSGGGDAAAEPRTLRSALILQLPARHTSRKRRSAVPDVTYSNLDYRLPELPHRYGDKVHLVGNPLLLSLLAVLGAKGTVQPQINRLVTVLYEDLVKMVLNRELPRKRVTVPTRMIDSTPK